MNSSSESLADSAYERMEYCEADECSSSGPLARSAEISVAETTEASPGSAAILEARLEEEKRTILAASRAEAERDILHARTAIAEAINQFSEQRGAYFRQVESEVVQLALSIARRIVNRESHVDPQLLAALVRYECERLDASTSVRLIVPPDALAYWSEAAKSMPHAVEVTAERSLDSSTLRMETALGSASINFESELKEIERSFFDLLSHRPRVEQMREVRVQ